nr:MAG TPA: hypothetical protein [Caudoviricetes sp.]
MTIVYHTLRTKSISLYVKFMKNPYRVSRTLPTFNLTSYHICYIIVLVNRVSFCVKTILTLIP